MPLFSVFHARDGGPEWRKSDWRIVDPLHQGRECPRPGCRAAVFGGQSWRDHWDGHRRQDEQLAAMDAQIRTLSKAVRLLALELGYQDWYPDLAGDDENEAGGEAPLTGYILGNGELPAETRGGGE